MIAATIRRAPTASFALFLLFAGVRLAAAQSPLAFDVSLAPNTSGAVEGTASLRWRWASFAESGLLFSSSGYLEEYAEAGGTTTVIRSQKSLDVDIFRIPSDLLALRFGSRSRVSLSPVALINGVVLDEDKYGQGTVPLAYVYYIGQRTMWAKPLLGADLNFELGSVSAEIHYRTSWPFTLNEYLEGAANYSTHGAVEFSVWDEGSEVRLGGQAAFRPAPGWKLQAGLDWLRHIGHAVAVTVPGYAPTDFVYESQSLEGSLMLTFPIGERRPMVGVAYARDAFKPVDTIWDKKAFTNSRIRFLFGLEL